MKPRYDYGQHVRVTRNVRNDGTFPGREVGELLLRRGATGYVRDIGTFLQDQIVYAVDFIEYGYRVGCREVELVPAEAPWIPNRYEFRDRVTFVVDLEVGGELIARAGDEGEVQKVLRDNERQLVSYHVRVAERTFVVPEPLLSGESEYDAQVQSTIAKGVGSSTDVRGATLPWQGV